MVGTAQTDPPKCYMQEGTELQAGTEIWMLSYERDTGDHVKLSERVPLGSPRPERGISGGGEKVNICTFPFTIPNVPLDEDRVYSIVTPAGGGLDLGYGELSHDIEVGIGLKYSPNRRLQRPVPIGMAPAR